MMNRVIASTTTNLGMVALIGSVSCALFLWLLLRTGLAQRLAIDEPNARSLHTRPTPRCGGWGMIPVILVAMAWISISLWPLMLGMLILALVSYLDDRRGLSARVRFMVHAVAVVLNLFFIAIDASPLGLLMSALAWLWMINLYNFMDGANGLAGAMTLTGFAAYAIAATISAQPSPDLALIAAAVVGTAIGFLFFNFPKARLFLGDVGSIPLGFLAAALGLIGWQAHTWPLWFPIMLFSPFIGDASVTLLKRALRGEKIWQAHREHYYQRMIQSGYSHVRMTSLWFLWMLGSCALAFYLLTQTASIQVMGLTVWVIALLIGAYLIDRRWSKFLHACAAPTQVKG